MSFLLRKWCDLNDLESTFEEEMKMVDQVYESMAMGSVEGIVETIQRFQEDEARIRDKYIRE